MQSLLGRSVAVKCIEDETSGPQASLAQPTIGPAGERVDPSMLRRAAIASCAGSFVECYDFLVGRQAQRVTGHDLAATRSGRLLIKPAKQDRTGVATTTEWTNPGQCIPKEQSDS